MDELDKMMIKTKKLLEIKICRLNELIEARPAGKIIEIRKEARVALIKYDINDPELHEILSRLSVEESKQLEIMKKQRDFIKLMDQKIDCERQLRKLKEEMWLRDARRNGTFR